MKQSKAYLLKIRGGVEIDSYGKKAGKGPLIQEEVSATLGTNQDQYLFQPILLDDQGGSQMSVRTDGKCGTLRAEAHGNLPCVMAYSFDALSSNSMKSKNPHSGCREVEVSKTIDTSYPDPSKNQGGIAIVMATQQGGAEIAIDLCPTITAAAGMSGNNQPIVCLEGNGTRPSHYGSGYSEADKMYTINTIERHAVAYAKEDNQSRISSDGFEDKNRAEGHSADFE